MEAFSSHQVVYYPYLSTRNFILASIIVIGSSLTTTFLIESRIKKIDMIEETKGVE